MSLASIQRSYYEIVEHYLGDIYASSPINPREAAVKYASNFTGRFIRTILPDFQEEINTFWQDNFKVSKNLLRRNPGLKTCFSGDIFPYECRKLLSRIGLYIDTIVLPDPILKVINYKEEFMSDRNRVFYLIEHAVNILNIEDLVVTDYDVPLVCIYPNEIFVNEDRGNVPGKEATFSAIEYFNELLGVELTSFDELVEFISLNEMELAKIIKNPTILPPNYYDEASTMQGLLKGKQELIQSGVTYLEDEPTGMYLLNYIFGRLMGISDHLMDCFEINTKPLYNAPSAWFMYKWKISNDSKKYLNSSGLDASTSIVNALQLDEFQWLGNMPIENVIKMREEGELSDIKSILRDNVNEIHDCNKSDLPLVANEINTALSKEFKKHEKELLELEKKYQRKMDKKEKLLVLGTLCITASYVFPPAAVLSILGGTSLLEVYSSTSEYLEKMNELNQKPIGILFNAYRDSGT